MKQKKSVQFHEKLLGTKAEDLMNFLLTRIINDFFCFRTKGLLDGDQQMFYFCWSSSVGDQLKPK